MAKNRKPNFLWISFEDTNPRYGCYGDPVARTPTFGPARSRGVPLDALFLHGWRLRSGSVGHYHRYVRDLHRHPSHAHGRTPIALRRRCPRRIRLSCRTT